MFLFFIFAFFCIVQPAIAEEESVTAATVAAPNSAAVLPATNGSQADSYSYYFISCGNYIEHKTNPKMQISVSADTYYVGGLAFGL